MRKGAGVREREPTLILNCLISLLLPFYISLVAEYNWLYLKRLEQKRGERGGLLHLFMARLSCQNAKNASSLDH